MKVDYCKILKPDPTGFHQITEVPASNKFRLYYIKADSTVEFNGQGMKKIFHASEVYVSIAEYIQVPACGWEVTYTATVMHLAKDP